MTEVPPALTNEVPDTTILLDIDAKPSETALFMLKLLDPNILGDIAPLGNGGGCVFFADVELISSETNELDNLIITVRVVTAAIERLGIAEALGFLEDFEAISEVIILDSVADKVLVVIGLSISVRWL